MARMWSRITKFSGQASILGDVSAGQHVLRLRAVLCRPERLPSCRGSCCRGSIIQRALVTAKLSGKNFTCTENCEEKHASGLAICRGGLKLFSLSKNNDNNFMVWRLLPARLIVMQVLIKRNSMKYSSLVLFSNVFLMLLSTYLVTKFCNYKLRHVIGSFQQTRWGLKYSSYVICYMANICLLLSKDKIKVKNVC